MGATAAGVSVPVFFDRPVGVAGTVQPADESPVVVGELSGSPALASWDRAGSAGQLRSAAFIDEVHTILAGPLGAISDPLALQLDVGLADSVSLFALNDLDNYLFPLVPKLTQRTGRQFASVWASKRHNGASTVRVTRAVPVGDPGGTLQVEVTTTASSGSAVYKQQVRDQVAGADLLPGDGVALQLAFVVGPRRAWPNLWKPTIDALGPILGHDPGAGAWNARDGRITDLGLHCVVQPDAGNRVKIAVRASAIGALPSNV